MARLNAIFTGALMGLVAGCLGVAAYFYFGMTRAESAIVALAAFTGLAVYNSIAARLRDRSDMGGQIADLSRGVADLARQVLELTRRTAAAEANADKALTQAAAVSGPLGSELERLRASIKQVAAVVAAQNAAPQAGAAGEPGPVATNDAEPASAGGTARFKDLDREAAIAVVREAVEGNQIEVALQPIVSLPQRKVRYYEALARLRRRDGEAIPPADFMPFASAIGFMGRIDNAMLFSCVQTVRRILGKNRDAALLYDVAAATLADPDSFPHFIEFADANRAIASSLVFGFAQTAFRAMGPVERESLGALADRGFRFALTHVGDLRLEPRELADRSFRFVKVPASLLLNRAAAAAADIDAAEFATILGRFNIDLIAETIERESAVVDLLDHDVRLGQGDLFSPPRPVRPEALQGAEAKKPEPPEPAPAQSGMAAADAGAVSAPDPAEPIPAQLTNG